MPVLNVLPPLWIPCSIRLLLLSNRCRSASSGSCCTLLFALLLLLPPLDDVPPERGGACASKSMNVRLQHGQGAPSCILTSHSTIHSWWKACGHSPLYEVTIVSPFSYPDKQMAHSFGTLLCAEAWDESADPNEDDRGLPISGGIRRKFLSNVSSRPSYWAINSSAFSEEISDSLIRSLISSIVSEEAVWLASKEPEVLTLRLPGPEVLLVFLKFLSKSSSLPSYLASKSSVLSFSTGAENKKARN